MCWPSPFFSEERELTGVSFDLELVVCVDDGSFREGSKAWVYRISDNAAEILASDHKQLSEYPMWSALAFDGYNLVRWSPLLELQSSPDHLLAEVLSTDCVTTVLPDDVSNMMEARELASSLARTESGLISGWYTAHHGSVTNYFIFVIDLNRKLLVKLSRIV